MTNDMTRGSPAKLILKFAFPILIGNLFQQFYSMADTIIVGRTLGVKALAAVGSTGAIFFLVIGFVQGVTSGFAVVTAQRFGAGDEKSVRQSVAISLWLSVVITVVVTLASVLTVHPLLRIMNTPADIYQNAYRYIIVIYFGIAATVFYNLLSCVIRALGDSKTPLYFLIVASVLNVGLDLLFIMAFQMGVAGAGWATVIAQAVSALLCLVYVIKKFPILHLKKEDFRWDASFTKIHLRVGLPMAFQFSITAVGVMILQSALNTFGSTTVAAFTAASKIEQIAQQFILSIGMAMATYCAQNFGAGKYTRIRRGMRSATWISMGFTALSAFIMVVLGPVLLRLFVSKQEIPSVLEQVQTYLVVSSIFFGALALLFVFRNALQGMGYALIPVLAGVAELLMRSVAAFVLADKMGYLGVCLASPIAWLGALVPLFLKYFPTLLKLAPRSAMRAERKEGDG